MNQMINTLIGLALMFEGTMKVNSEEWKERLRKEHANLQNLPRKKKKREKKRILAEWNVACWEPYVNSIDILKTLNNE